MSVSFSLVTIEGLHLVREKPWESEVFCSRTPRNSPSQRFIDTIALAITPLETTLYLRLSYTIKIKNKYETRHQRRVNVLAITSFWRCRSVFLKWMWWQFSGYVSLGEPSNMQKHSPISTERRGLAHNFSLQKLLSSLAVTSGLLSHPTCGLCL